MKRPRAQSGFTLIELMIVLVIVGVGTALVSLSLPHDAGQELRLDARELAQRFTIAQEEVRLDGRVIAWEADRAGYRFLRGRWQSQPGSVVPTVSTQGALDTFDMDDTLRERQWRAGEVDVSPAGPVLLTSEWIGSTWQLELRSNTATAVIVRDATGRFAVR